MKRTTEQETADEKTARRIALIQQWLSTKSMEIRRTAFYGELTVTLRFEDGQCVLGEHQVREKTK